jgi:lysozyme
MFEGLYLTPYLCPAGIPTIGYGATYYQDGRRVTLKDPAITREQAEELLLWMLKTVYLPKVILLCPVIIHESPNRIAAIIDFVFNLGDGRLRGSTLRRKINDGNWDAVPAELMKWVIGGGRVLRGLVTRRKTEMEMI